MKTNFILRKKLAALALLIAFTTPFVLNSLHFILFEHHNHAHEHHNELSFNKSTETHSNCLWDFSVSDLYSNEISLNSLSFIFINHQESRNLDFVYSFSFHFGLRAPPTSFV